MNQLRVEEARVRVKLGRISSEKRSTGKTPMHGKCLNLRRFIYMATKERVASGATVTGSRVIHFSTNMARVIAL